MKHSYQAFDFGHVTLRAVCAMFAALTPSAVPAAGQSNAVRVEINIPAFRMDVISADSSWSAPIAVGLRKYPTPIGSFQVRSVTWNPWWIPPESEWARKEKPKPPGPENPMGKVKLQIVDLVFLHGTPWVESLGRAASHACIRMADSSAIRLATQVHQLHWENAAVDSVRRFLADSTQTVRIPINATIPVTVHYQLAEVRHDSLWVYPNVYRRADANVRAHVTRALLAAAIDTSGIDRKALDSFLRRSRTTHRAVAIQSLMRRDTTPGVAGNVVAVPRINRGLR